MGPDHYHPFQTLPDEGQVVQSVYCSIIMMNGSNETMIKSEVHVPKKNMTDVQMQVDTLQIRNAKIIRSY